MAKAPGSCFNKVGFGSAAAAILVREMPRHLFKQYAPDHQKIRDHRHLRMFGRLLHDPNLWHMNRRSISGAFAVGLFWAFIPVPFQMVAAAAVAIPARVNLPMSVALVWITNPVTMPAVFYMAYKIGALLIDVPVQDVKFELSFHWMSHTLAKIWKPFLLGCFLCALFFGSVGYFTISMLWRWRVARHWNQRKKRREQARRMLEQQRAGVSSGPD